MNSGERRDRVHRGEEGGGEERGGGNAGDAWRTENVLDTRRLSPPKDRVTHTRVCNMRDIIPRILRIFGALTDQRKYAGLVEQRLETVFDESGRGAVLVTHFTHCATKPT